ncbi:LmbE family N-acetylglucosaminyl deacetylase [Arthrobacter sp. PvP102]|uniref:bifunctional PIG-L family deacetylase/class I SAM-dependent methyltransferase n=1 Tax=unclassified Arthrobacter TaxID=235627 RepID=UPI001AEB0E40|nr:MULTISPECIES: bifunctional PIG-L family deacetylase/class I SAM-dependent methyltransferase [unclassified Arthrobacter]MBP1233890.1 LmbE family N-acetylglucosaminyl deacetylase [Arthrobacter sp. PvP103]MBP1239024.1 LmbE family N-acetylglucosaminyl deacetylase [Arthrobacter sp. PvP102]
MVTFSHADTGTAESEWEASGLSVLPELPLDPGELAAMTFIVLAAHPDDETLGAGGFLSRLHAAGSAVDVLLCTAGEASHPDSPTTTPDQLAAVRLHEFRAAVSGLAPAASRQFLHFRDGHLDADRDRIAAAVRETIDASGRPANQVVIVAPYRSDGHTDHDVLGAVAAEVAAQGGHGLLEYPVWYWLWASPEDRAWQSWVRVPLTPDEQRAKAAALLAHSSQTQPLSDQPGDEALLAGSFLDHFSRAWETFAWHRPAGGTNSAGGAEQIFDAVHSRSADPWSYTTSWYERRKRALTLAILPEANYGSGLEIGCSIGTLSVELASRCREFVAVDASSTALAQAAERLSGYPSARTLHLTVPQHWPEGRFDLVVVSETGYYLTAEELAELFAQVEGSLNPGGTLVLCHWRHPVSGWELDGDTVHALARQQLRWPTEGLYREKDFVLEVLVAPDGARAGAAVPEPHPASGPDAP